MSMPSQLRRSFCAAWIVVSQPQKVSRVCALDGAEDGEMAQNFSNDHSLKSMITSEADRIGGQQSAKELPEIDAVRQLQRAQQGFSDCFGR